MANGPLEARGPHDNISYYFRAIDYKMSTYYPQTRFALRLQFYCILATARQCLSHDPRLVSRHLFITPISPV